MVRTLVWIVVGIAALALLAYVFVQLFLVEGIQ
jgi:hypothetical protein